MCAKSHAISAITALKKCQGKKTTLTVEKREPSYTIGRNVSLCGHHGRQHVDSLKN